MASNKPIRRQIAWLFLIPQLIIFQLIIIIFNFFITPFDLAVNLALLFYLGVFFLLRTLIPHNHRKGIRLIKSDSYAEAIIEFEKSYDFFMQHPWIDRYRFLVLLSSSKTSYTEMALTNAAFCYTQTGNGQKAVEYYEKALHLFPDSEMAKSALKMLHSFNPDVFDEQNSRL